jgi:hypothetical protein
MPGRDVAQEVQREVGQEVGDQRDHRRAHDRVPRDIPAGIPLELPHEPVDATEAGTSEAGNVWRRHAWAILQPLPHSYNSPVVTSGSWGVRSYYFSPFLLLLVVAIARGSAVVMVAAGVVAVFAAVRASRIAVVTTGEGVLVRNFWATYRVGPSDVVAWDRVKIAGFFGWVRWPHSLVVLQLQGNHAVRVVASAHASIWGERSGNAAEVALRPLLAAGQ